MKQEHIWILGFTAAQEEPTQMIYHLHSGFWS